MSSTPLWPAEVPVDEHLARVRRWGGPDLWLEALDRAQMILSPRFTGHWDNGYCLQDAAPALAMLIYLLARIGECPPEEISEQKLIDAYPSAERGPAFLGPSTPRDIHECFTAALRHCGHDVDHGDVDDPVVRTYRYVLLRAYPAPEQDTPDDSDRRVGSVLRTGLLPLIMELATPGLWLVPRPNS